MTKANTARSAMIDAFTTLIMAKRFSQISVQEVCRTALVGRSTFYTHFHSLSELLMAAIAPIVDELAGELLENPRQATRTSQIVAHIWQQRRLGELWRDPDFRDQFEDALFLQLLAVGEDLQPQVALFCAAGVTSTLRNWVAGRLSASPQEMTARLIGTCHACISINQIYS